MSMFPIETYREFAPHNTQEWLLTNGLGGYASSTVLGMNTRRYHGLLVAATMRPVGRINTISRIGELLTFDDTPGTTYELSINTFKGMIHPRGDRHLTHFDLGDTARWRYNVQGIRITKELQLCWKKNISAVRYTIEPGGRGFSLELMPFCSLRDFHSLRRFDGSSFDSTVNPRGVTVTEGSNSMSIYSDVGRFIPKPEWWYGHVYPIEAERGQDDLEDLWCPGRFTISAKATTTITLWFGPELTDPGDWDGELRRRTMEISSLCTRPACPSPVVQRLVRAANDFVVDRQSPDGKPGSTVIAGYPWFGDWGRDTMISLPGLLLCTGRFDQAKQVLTTFAQYVSGGMIPNRFNDYTNEPEYNTVDASLWFIHACFEYSRMSGDLLTLEKTLKPACRQILDGYRNGTRYGIKMDPADNLITQGDANTQLTWMDAKCGDIAFTPRQGKPVEINALWHHVLVLMNETALAEQVANNFQRAFWIGPEHGLADVVHDGHRDESIRPNQIFAVSLPNSPLTESQQATVVAVVARELLTPVGLRTLNRTNPGFKGHYCGPQMQRDAAYHNGTVWPWLLGPFLDAYLKMNNQSAAAVAKAREWLWPVIVHMTTEAAIGQISEIYEGDAPHAPVGCPAQAWSVAEVLRLAIDLGM